MKRMLIAAAVTAAAAVPAVTGLVGNASFAQSVPVHVPANARVVDDHGRQADPRDDRGRQAEPGDDRGQRAEPGDDHGVNAEPRDDRAGASSPAAATSARHGGHDDGSADR